MKITHTRTWPVLLVLLLASAGCTRHVSKDINPQGQAGEVIFPEIKPDKTPKGTFPNIENLRQISPGVNKDQLYALIGPPHFKEGYFHVREWDYVFNFRTGNGSEYVTCQYKIIFDKDYLAQSFHWKGENCEQYLKPQAQFAQAQLAQIVNLSTDALFAYSKYGAQDIKDEGRQQVVALGQKIAGQGVEVASVIVAGHTDQIGSDADNLILSQRRANTVRELLIQAGVPSEKIRAIGYGKTQPVATCEESLSTTDRIACLQPNRRVEVQIAAVQREQ